jgi:hypothetical protein
MKYFRNDWENFHINLKILLIAIAICITIIIYGTTRKQSPHASATGPHPSPHSSQFGKLKSQHRAGLKITSVFSKHNVFPGSGAHTNYFGIEAQTRSIIYIMLNTQAHERVVKSISQHRKILDSGRRPGEARARRENKMNSNRVLLIIAMNQRTV